MCMSQRVAEDLIQMPPKCQQVVVEKIHIKPAEWLNHLLVEGEVDKEKKMSYCMSVTVH